MKKFTRAATNVESRGGKKKSVTSGEHGEGGGGGGGGGDGRLTTTSIVANEGRKKPHRAHFTPAPAVPVVTRGSNSGVGGGSRGVGGTAGVQTAGGFDWQGAGGSGTAGDVGKANKYLTSEEIGDAIQGAEEELFLAYHASQVRFPSFARLFRRYLFCRTSAVLGPRLASKSSSSPSGFRV